VSACIFQRLAERVRIPPRWVVAVSLAVAGTLPGDSLLYAVLPIVWSELGLELWMVGVLLSANRLVRLVTNPIAGWCVERTGMRGPFLLAVFASVGTTAAYALGSGFALLLLARVLWGVCWSFLRLGGFLAVLESADATSRGYYMGFHTGVARLGTLFAVLVGGLLTDQLGFRATALAFASITLAAGFLMLRERPPSAGQARTRAAPGREADAALVPDPAGERSRRWAVYAAIFVVQASASGLVVATLGLWLVERFGDEVHLGALVLGVATLNGILLAARFSIDASWAPFAGHLSDRHGRFGFLLLSGLTTAVGLLGLTAVTSLAGTAALALLFFVGSTALRVTIDATAGDLAPAPIRSRVMSWYASWTDLGAAMGPFVAYPLAETVGLEWVYRGGAGCLLLAGGTALSILLGGRARRSDSSGSAS
jgi:MFS family permease